MGLGPADIIHDGLVDDLLECGRIGSEGTCGKRRKRQLRFSDDIDPESDRIAPDFFSDDAFVLAVR